MRLVSYLVSAFSPVAVSRMFALFAEILAVDRGLLFTRILPILFGNVRKVVNMVTKWLQLCFDYNI